MLKRMSTVSCASALVIGCIACNDPEQDNPQTPPPPPQTESLPSALTPVAMGEFEQPADAVSSHDGQTFYFTAYVSEEGENVPAVLSVPASGGSAQRLSQGAPLGHPTGLVLSCDGSTLYVADLSREPDDVEGAESEADLGGAIYALDVASGALRMLPSEGIDAPAGLALSVDCSTLYVSGTNTAGAPGVFTLSTTGGPVRTVLAGDPLVAPTGLHVDVDEVAWVMDHLALGEEGPGVLFAVNPDGTFTEVMSDLRMGTPGGVSLNSSGSTAFMPTLDENGRGQLTSVSLSTGEVVQIPAEGLTDPAGIRTARNASVFAVVDAENGVIYRAE